MCKYTKCCLRNAKIINHYKKKLCITKKEQHSELNVCLSTTEIENYQKQKTKKISGKRKRRSSSYVDVKGRRSSQENIFDLDIKEEIDDDNQLINPGEIKQEIDITEHFQYKSDQILRDAVETQEDILTHIKTERVSDFIFYHEEPSRNTCYKDVTEIEANQRGNSLTIASTKETIRNNETILAKETFNKNEKNKSAVLEKKITNIDDGQKSKSSTYIPEGKNSLNPTDNFEYDKSHKSYCILIQPIKLLIDLVKGIHNIYEMR